MQQEVKRLPRYVSEWIVAKFCEEEVTEECLNKISALVHKYLHENADGRYEFTLEEWLNILISSIGLENVNLIELGLKGTGKTYCNFWRIKRLHGKINRGIHKVQSSTLI
ncbi:MAG: hypothetical protein ACE5J9_06550 [Methanosarcinales archaeon]